jgi:purine-binding chemotaxis protein CheW
VGNASEGAGILEFCTGDRTHALLLGVVEKVELSVEVTPLPDAPRNVIGIVEWGGKILPVLSMRRRLCLPERAIGPEDRLIIARSSRRPLALLVDEITGVRVLTAEDIVAAGDIWQDIGGLAGVARLAGDVVLIHDLDAFLDVTEEAALEKALAGSGSPA